MFIRLDRVPACGKRTDGQTEGIAVYSALHCKQCGRAVKMFTSDKMAGGLSAPDTPKYGPGPGDMGDIIIFI